MKTGHYPLRYESVWSAVLLVTRNPEKTGRQDYWLSEFGVVLSSQKPCADTWKGPFCSAGQSPRSVNARAKGEGWVTSSSRHGYHMFFFFSRINLVPYSLPSGWLRTAGAWCGKDGFLAELCAPSDKSSAGVGKELMC